MSETVPPAATGAPSVKSPSDTSPATTPSAVFSAVPPAATGAPGVKSPFDASPATTPSAVFSAVPPAATGAPGVKSPFDASPVTIPSAVFSAVPPAATGAPGVKAPDAPAPKNYSTDPTLYLYTSLTAGSSHIVTATSRMETILKANRIPFTGRDLATDEKARMLWGRRSGKDAQGRVRKLPGLVQEGLVIGDVVEIEDWNEYGELKQHVKIVGTHNLVGPAKPLLKKNQAASQLSGKSTTSTIPGSKSTAPTASKTSTPIADQATKPSGSPALAPRLAEEVKEKQNATIGITSAMREMALEASQKVKDLRKKGTEATITASSTATSVASTAAATVGGVATTATNTAQVVLPETLGRKPEPTVPEEKVAEKAEEELKNERIAPDGAVKSEKIEDKSAASESAGSSTPPSLSLKTAPASDDALASKRVKICEPVKSEKKEKNSTNSVNEKASAQTETGAWVPTDINPPIRSHRGSEVEEAPRDEVRRIERELVIAEGNEDDNEDADEDAVVNDDKNEEPVKEEEREKKGDVMNEEVLASSQSDEKENRKVEEVIETVVDKEGKVPQPKNDYASLYEL